MWRLTRPWPALQPVKIPFGALIPRSAGIKALQALPRTSRTSSDHPHQIPSVDLGLGVALATVASTALGWTDFGMAELLMDSAISSER